MLLTETTSKIYRPRSYNDAVNNLVYSCHYIKVIKEKLQNLKSH